MALATGTRLGPYEIKAPLGAGGMGEVYLARDTRLRRDVALKVLPDAVARDPNRLARLEREARVLAGLSHPNIVVIYSIERDGDVRFITMELVEGQGLDRHVVPEGMPVGRILDLSIGIAEALSAAHGKGVVHRDLKPANVVVTSDGRVKVLDFGLAKLMLPESNLDATLTRTAESPLSMAGDVAGTVPYMAPEQLRGEPADARTDLFALGVILYELASGRRPFVGSTHVDLSSAILRDTPPGLTSMRADLPADLARVVGRLLEKAPGDRFQSALEARDALRLIQRTLEGGASARRSTTAPSIAVLPFSNMSADPENEYFSDGLTEELLNALAKIPNLKVTGRTSSFAFKGRHEDLRGIGEKLGVGTLLEGSVRKAGSRVRITAQLINVADGFHMWSETYDRVLDDIFAVQDDIAHSVSTALHVTLMGRRATGSRANAESYELVLRGNHFLAQNTGPAIAKAVSLYREAIELSPDNALAWASLARAHSFQAGYGYAELNESHSSARNAAERALALDDELPEAHEVMGMILGYLEFRWKEAMEAVRRARLLAPGASSSMVSMSMYEGTIGRMDEALRLARQAQEIDPLNPNVHANRSRVEMWASNLEAASKACLRALELSPGMTAMHTHLGLLCLRRGMPEEGIEEIQKEATRGYRDYGLAIAYHVVGKKEESDAALARLLEEGEAWGFQVATIHACRGERDEAFRWLERSYELHDTGIPAIRVTQYFRNIHSDPRWPRFMEKIGLSD